MKWPFALRKSLDAANERVSMANERAMRSYWESRAKDEIIAALRQIMEGLIKSDRAVEHLAAAFANMSDDQQANFFTIVAKIASTWPTGGFTMNQWHMVGMHENMTAEGAEICREIASMWDYAQEEKAKEPPCPT